MAVTTSYEEAAAVQDAGAVRSAAAAEALLLELVQRHADELLRVARSHSLCADDAHDAYQRSLEVFLRNGRRLRRESARQWLFTVLKREAQAVRRAREELVGIDELDLSRVEARSDASPEERVLAADAVARSAEALRGLKPHEVRALWLQADGSSYAEIAAATGWTYTKVNRSLTEGRRRFLRRCADLEAGTDCRRRRGALVALVAGEATSTELAALRPHLRSCAACRATVRALHRSGDALGVVLPPGVVVGGTALAAGGEDGTLVGRLYEAFATGVQERATAGIAKWQAAAEVAAGGKVAAVAASTVALAGGGAVGASETPAPPPAVAREAPPRNAPEAPVPQAATPAATPVAAEAPAVPTPAAAAAARTPAAPAVRRGSPGRAEFGVAATDAGAPAPEFAGPARERRAPVPPSTGPATPQPAPKAVVSTEFASAPRKAPSPAAASPAAAEFGP